MKGARLDLARVVLAELDAGGEVGEAEAERARGSSIRSPTLSYRTANDVQLSEF